jgi:hypothetical protein
MPHPKATSKSFYTAAMRDKPFYIRFKTADGTLVQDRRSTVEYYYRHNGTVDTEFVNDTLKRDCCTKGVRVVSYTITVAGIDAIVAWPK